MLGSGELGHWQETPLPLSKELIVSDFPIVCLLHFLLSLQSVFQFIDLLTYCPYTMASTSDFPFVFQMSAYAQILIFLNSF